MTDPNQLPEKPRPEVAPENQPHWDALREHRYVVQQCANCHKLRHYPRPMCDECYAMDYDWQALSGRGVIHSWTVSHHPFHPGFKREVPYATVTVDMAEGVRIQAPIVDVPSDALAIGMSVKLAYRDIDDELTLPYFRSA